jgi:hypothetical protein
MYCLAYFEVKMYLLLALKVKPLCTVWHILADNLALNDSRHLTTLVVVNRQKTQQLSHLSLDDSFYVFVFVPRLRPRPCPRLRLRPRLRPRLGCPHRPHQHGSRGKELPIKNADVSDNTFSFFFSLRSLTG